MSWTKAAGTSLNSVGANVYFGMIVQTITVAEFHQHMVDYEVIDVREPHEYDDGHISGVKNIPLQDFLDMISSKTFHPKKTLVIVCRSGRRSGMAVSECMVHGIPAKNLKGGFEEWCRSYPNG